MITEHVSDKVWRPLLFSVNEVRKQLVRSAAEEIKNPGWLIYSLWPTPDLKFSIKEALEAKL